jgi:hypothetical protein
LKLVIHAEVEGVAFVAWRGVVADPIQTIFNDFDFHADTNNLNVMAVETLPSFLSEFSTIMLAQIGPSGWFCPVLIINTQWCKPNLL